MPRFRLTAYHLTDHQQDSTPSDSEPGEEEGTDPGAEPVHKKTKPEKNGGNDESISSKRKRVESTTKPESPPPKKPACPNKSKSTLFSDEEELSELTPEEDNEDSGRAAELKKPGKTKSSNPPKVKARAASRKPRSRAADEVEDSDHAEDKSSKAPSRKSKSSKEGTKTKG